MSVNFEIKGMLARLLATEDLIVENKKVETACFNVQTRVLTLPMWERASNNVYDLLLSHESAHAIYTDNIDWTKDYNIPGQFVNVVEDARIEKLMKRRYAGLAKTFYNGYKELAEDDFFQIGDDNLETYNLADRANLYFKIGNFTHIPIQSGEESEIIDLIANTETFADVLIAAEVLYKYCTKNQQQQTKVDLNINLPPQMGGGSIEGADLTNQQEGENDSPEENNSESLEGIKSPLQNQQKRSSQEDSSNETQPSDTSSQSLGGKSGAEKQDPKVKTMESLESAIKKLTNNSNFYETVYIELPELDLKKVIVPNSEIHKKCEEAWGKPSDICPSRADEDFKKFKLSAQKEVNYLVKEFECRKAADSYARASTSRTGVLDCSKLHTYKYNEDLFKKVTTLANGKNHGLVFVLDWSGSMSNVMLDTVKQLFNLIWFCKKVSIPFEVYAFTQDYPPVTYDDNLKAKIRECAYSPRDGLVFIGEWFSMMNLLTSKTNNKTLEIQIKNIWRLACAFKSGYYPEYKVPHGLSLSGTPLNESLVSLHQILPKFQRENKLQKVQCVILTDGEAGGFSYHRTVKPYPNKDSYLGTGYVPNNAVLRDRKIGNTYSVSGGSFGLTKVLLHNLRDKFTDINFIGIRVLESRECGSFIRNYRQSVEEELQAMNDWKKHRSFSLKNAGYHTYFGISGTSLSRESEFEVAEDASKAQIRNAFMKSLKTKKMNKKILGEFIDLIA